MAVKNYLDKEGLQLFHDTLKSTYIDPITTEMASLVTESEVETTIDENVTAISASTIAELFVIED